MGKHRKWKDTMVLEVQDGGEGLHHFCSRDIQWMPICVENDSTTDLCAAIPLDRLDAFMRGESLHEDNNGEACHGVDDTNNELRSQFAPNLCDECKAYIERLLLMDVSIDAIVDRHLDDPIFHDMLKKRDSFMMRKDVINATTRVRSIRSRKHVHDATSILEWKKQDQANFFFFQQPQGVLVAWALTSRNKIKDIQVWLMELWRRGKEKRPNWRINAFIMDDASAKIQAIQ
ncbi:hypothetical protein SUGI_0824090 [Cryptomeria japonica]|nr:hypothetical protein SUGI_0824090 [Cryptomeria japonica]